MVIKNILSFINSILEAQVHEVHDTKLLIDGNGLQYHLYRLSSSAQKDYIFSSDYPTYAEYVKRFLRRLMICKVEPIIFYEGSIDLQRYNKAFDERIIEINQIYESGYKCRPQSPTLANYVFSSVMRQFGVKIVQTYSQTLRTVVSLANSLKCPLMSDKSDFYFMNIESGFIRLDGLKWLNHKLFYSEKYWYFKCNRYHINHLLKKYKGLRRETIPLFATIIENQLISRENNEKLKKEINYETNRRQLGVNRNHQDFDFLLNWLRNKSVEEVLDLLKNCVKSKLSTIEEESSVEMIRNLMKKYETTEISEDMSQLFSTSSDGSESNFLEVKNFAEGDVLVLPKWFLAEYQKGIIRPSIMNIVRMKTHVLYPQIENFCLPSSYECTKSLRRFLYGLLRTESDCKTNIKVMDRKGLEKVIEEVTPLQYMSDGHELPILSTVRSLDIGQRKQLFMDILGISQSFINRSKISLVLYDWCENSETIDTWIFQIIVMRYWVTNNKEEDWKPFIGALILSLIFYSQRDLQRDQNWKELCFAPEVNEKFKPSIVHYFSQFQACLHIIDFINTILEFPLPEGISYFYLNGIFLYKAFLELSLIEDEKQYISRLFGKWTVARLYYKILHLVLYGLDFHINAREDIE